MGTTNINSSNSLANKQFSRMLSAMAVRAATPINTLTGPMPSHEDAMRKLRQQTTTEMPIVRVDELIAGPGTKVQLDCAHVVKPRAVMGDRNAEGLGAPLTYSSVEINIDMATLPFSAGGKMSQKRTPHSLRKNALAQLRSSMPRFRWQRILTALAGARGTQDGQDWVLPLGTDNEFAEMMVNPVQAPTYNRHYVVDAGTLIQGGQQLGSIDTTDLMKLSVIDELSAIWSELSVRMAPIEIPGDPAAGDDPIKGVFLVDELVWDAILTDTTATNNIRLWEANAMKRAEYGNLRAHPLFSGRPLMWNGILVRKMFTGIRFGASVNVPIITAANRLTGTESNQAVAAGLSTTHVVARSLFLGAQALGMASGGNSDSEETYSLLEHSTNYGRNIELAGEMIGGEQKLRWALPNSNGDLEPTDFGVMAIDSAVKIRTN